jgi:predicted small secreted protein
MKRIFLSITAVALLAISITACNNGAKTATGTDSTAVAASDTSSTMEEATAPVTDSTKTASTTSSSDASVPTFENEEVTKYCKEYQEVMDSYVAAMKSKDAAKTGELTKKLTDLGQKGGTLMTKVKPEEAKKLTDFMTAVSKKMTDAAMAK